MSSPAPMVLRASNLARVVALATLLVSGTALAAPFPSARSPREGVANALVHASVAAKIGSLAGVHLHLHHVINCLEGPHSALYSAKAEALSAYHCDGLSAGAADDPNASARVRHLGLRAVQEALAGITSTSVRVGHRDAASVIATLHALQAAWPGASHA